MFVSYNIIRSLSSRIPPNLRRNLIILAKPFHRLILGNVNYVVFSPTFRCNYNCPYCLINTKINYAKKYSKNNEYDYREWITALNRFPCSLIYISGGEPLIFPGLTDLIREISKKHLIGSLNTNLSSDISKLMKINQKNIMSVAASFHPHMTEKEGFAKKVRKLKENGFIVKVSLVAYPQILDSIDDFKMYFLEKLGVEFIIEPYLDPTYEYSEEEKILVRNYVKPDRKIGYDFNDDRPKKCDAGSKYFMIIPNGDVYTCYAGFYNDTSSIHKRYFKKGRFYLGNLFDGTFKKMSKQKICSIPCSEACDISLSKVKPIRRI